MALTYRGQLDRPLTQEEIDANFAYFTGSHGITGSLGISGSIIPAVGVGQTTSSFSLGSETAAWKDIYVSEGSIKFVKSGSEAVVLSAKDGGIQVNGGPTISADGINGQFFTSKSLDTDITVKDSNNSLLMGPIDVEEGKEIVVEEDSDLTIFGDIEVTDVANAENSVFAISASYSSEAISASYASSASYADNTTSSSFASTSSVATSASYALTASYALNATATSTFPYSGSAVITGSLLVNDGTNSVVNTSNYSLYDNNGDVSINWSDRRIYSSDGFKSVAAEDRILHDSNNATSLDWENRTLNYSNGNAAIDYSNTASLTLTNTSTSGSVLITSSLINIDASNSFRIRNLSGNSEASGSISAGGSTLTIGKYSTFETNPAGGLTLKSQNVTITGSINLNANGGVYGFTSASNLNTGSSPGITSNTAIAFSQNGSNFFIYVYIGGQWRSASLS
jgi:hypothetical protein